MTFSLGLVWVKFHQAEMAEPNTKVRMTRPASAGATEDVGVTPGLGRSPGERNGNPLQCPCLGNDSIISLDTLKHVEYFVSFLINSW